MAEDPRKIPRDPSDPVLRLPEGSSEGAHLNSPAGGPGPGRFKDTFKRELIKGGARVVIGPFLGPLGGLLTDYLLDHKANAKHVLEACEIALNKYVGNEIEKETGRAIAELLEGILYGLVMMLAIVAATTGLGAAAGAAIGSLAFGVGAAPGAAVGAELGFDAGIWILEWMGLAFLALYVGKNLGEVTGLLAIGVERAWNAGKHGTTEQADIDAGAVKIARAVAVLFRLILEAIVMYLLAEGVAAVANRLPRLLKGLKESKLGKGFAEWVEKNYKGMMEDPRLNPKLRKPKEGAGVSAAEGGGPKGQPPKSDKPSSPKPTPKAPNPEAKKIAEGHAYDKHVTQQKEFPEIKDKQAFAEHIDDVMANPSASKSLSGGRKAYWDDKSQTVVITNPKAVDGGTAFKPKDGKAYFDNLK